MRLMCWSRIKNGFTGLWAAVALALVLASAPSMAAHMEAYPTVAPESVQLMPDQVRSSTDHDDGHVGQASTGGECQDVCCSGTCVSADLSGDDVHSPNIPGMVHRGMRAVELVPTDANGLLRPPRL